MTQTRDGSQTGFVYADFSYEVLLLLLLFHTVLGFTLYEDTVNGRAATHQLYGFAIQVWPMCTRLATDAKRKANILSSAGTNKA